MVQGFFDAMTSADVLGENLMPTHSTSGDAVLDWFFWMGGARNKSPEAIVRKFTRAYYVDRPLALRSLFHLRDVRGGMGERRSFRIVARWLAMYRPDDIRHNVHNIPYFGRWDDVLAVALQTPVEDEALAMIWAALSEGDRMAAKWMPREGKSLDAVAKYLMRKLHLSPRQYRKLLAGGTDVVENKMCANEWDEIEYSHVPSVAFRKYRAAFRRHDEERFDEFLDDVESGEKKVHAGAIFPHDVIGREVLERPFSVDPGERRAIEAQWDNLPDYKAPGGTLVVADVSGSMTTGDRLPIRVSVSLAMYFAERLEGPFKDIVCTFSSYPEFVKLPDRGIVAKAQTVKGMHWERNTDLQAVFEHVLAQAVKHDLPQEQMPSTILILSDMQFDFCTNNAGETAMQMIRRKYGLAGYEMPKVVFWNLRSSIGIPAKATESSVALLSGFSPSLMRAVMQGDADPRSKMLRILESERYDRVIITE